MIVGSKAAAWAAMLVAIATCGAPALANTATTPGAGDDNPQLTPEMFSPDPLGPPQVLKYPASIVRSARPPASKIEPQRSTPMPKSEPTKQALMPLRHPAKKHVAPVRAARGRSLETVYLSHHELPPMAYSPAAPRSQRCAPALRAFMSSQELNACGWLPIGSRTAPSTSEGAIY